MGTSGQIASLEKLLPFQIYGNANKNKKYTAEFESFFFFESFLESPGAQYGKRTQSHNWKQKVKTFPIKETDRCSLACEL